MVVMRRLAADVGVLPAGQIDALDQIKAGQQLQRAEDGGATEAGALTPGRPKEVLGGEMTLPLGNQPGHAATGGGNPISMLLQRRHDRFVGNHAGMLSGIETESQQAQS
jgi:hypothetical protein